MEYRAKVTCWHKCRLYEKGEIADFAEGENVPQWFEAIKKASVKPEATPDVSEARPKKATKRK